MASISVSSLILFITSMVIAVGVVGVFTTSVDDLSGAIGDRGVQVSDDVRTSVDIISDGDSDNVYDADSETTTVYLKNTGSQSLDPVPAQIDLLLDGEFVTSDDLELTVLGDGDDDTWGRDEVLRVTVTGALDPGHHDVRVIVNGDEESLAFTVDEDPVGEPVEPAFFEVSSLDAEPDPVDPGEEVDIDATIENTGDESDTQEVSVFVDDEEISETTEELDGGESTEIAETYQTTDEDAEQGEISIRVETDDDSQEITVQVNPKFEVIELDAPDTVQVEETVDIETEITNNGDESDSTQVSIFVDEEEVRSEPVTIDPGDTVVIDHQYETDEDDPPEIEITVETDDDEETETVTVEEREDV